jgi:hypothetical protein
MKNLQKLADGASWLYPVGLYYIVLSVLDLSVRAYPTNVTNVGWRFALMGMVFTNIGSILLGFSGVVAIALIREHVVALRVFSVFAFIVAVGMLGGVAFYALDAVQLRGLANETARLPILKAAMTAIPAGFVGAFSFLGIGVFIHRTLRMRRQQSSKSASPLESIVPRYPNVSGGVIK